MIFIKKSKFIILIIIFLIIIVGAIFVPLLEYTVTFHDTHVSLPDKVTFTNATNANIDNESDSIYTIFSGEDYEGTLFMFDNQTKFRQVLEGVDFSNMTVIYSDTSLKIYENKYCPTCVIFAEIDGYPFMYSIKSTSYDKALEKIYEFKKMNPRIKNLDV